MASKKKKKINSKIKKNIKYKDLIKCYEVFVMRNILKIVFVIIGTLIGAGFASGQEINLFFFSYGEKGIVGIIITGIIIGYVVYKIFSITYGHRVNNYKEFLELLKDIGQNENYAKIKQDETLINKITNIINMVINIFTLVTFFIMIAGFGAYLEQEYQMKSIYGSAILAIICFSIFIRKTKGLIKVNEIITPILIISIIAIGIINLRDIQIVQIKNHLTNNINGKWLISSILYASYNSILLIPVLIVLSKQIKNKKDVAPIVLISTVITIFLAISIFCILIKIDVDINNLEMPVIYVVSKMGKVFQKIYGFIILGSILTTAISLGMSFLQNMSQNEKSYTHIAVIMCITSVVISKIGFTKLIQFFYPIFGCLGMLQIVLLNRYKKN